MELPPCALARNGTLTLGDACIFGESNEFLWSGTRISTNTLR